MTKPTALLRPMILGCLLMVAGTSLAGGGGAVASYKKGRMLIEQRRYEDALVELEKSNAEMPSPNTLLLIAHANRELGRLETAAGQYERVLAEAEARATQGEQRFRATASDARSWLDKLSAELGRISVSVSGGAFDTVVRINGTIVSASSSDGGVLKFDGVWVKPGQVVVTADQSGRPSKRVSVDVPRGGPASVVIDLLQADAAPSAPIEAPAAKDDGSSKSSGSVPTATWVLGGVGVAGLAAFGVFGSMARSKANELDACSPRCPESERATADAGKRDQTIANVGLVVGALGLAAAGGFYIWRPAQTPEQAGVSLHPGGVSVSGRF